MAKQNLLLVDADQRSLRVLEVSLRKAGYSVTTCVDAVTAIEMIGLSRPDMIISDTRLPDVDGFQLVERLRASEESRDIPFMFLSSDGSVESKVKGLELGVEDYLTKPIYIKEIITRVNLELQRRQRVGLERRSVETKTRFSGSLADMGLVDLLQTIDISRKSGVLHLTSTSGQRGAIYFDVGGLKHAELGKLRGEWALYRALVWNEGTFELEFRPVRLEEETISMSTQGLLMEGMRRLDEWGRLLEQLPPLDAVFEIDEAELRERLAEIPDEINDVLKYFDGVRSLLDVVDEVATDDLETLAAISKLYFEGLIVDSGMRTSMLTPPAPRDGTGSESGADESDADMDEEAAAMAAAGVVPGESGDLLVSSGETPLAPEDFGETLEAAPLPLTPRLGPASLAGMRATDSEPPPARERPQRERSDTSPGLAGGEVVPPKVDEDETERAIGTLGADPTPEPPPVEATEPPSEAHANPDAATDADVSAVPAGAPGHGAGSPGSDALPSALPNESAPVETREPRVARVGAETLPGNVIRFPQKGGAALALAEPESDSEQAPPEPPLAVEPPPVQEPPPPVASAGASSESGAHPRPSDVGVAPVAVGVPVPAPEAPLTRASQAASASAARDASARPTDGAAPTVTAKEGRAPGEFSDEFFVAESYESDRASQPSPGAKGKAKGAAVAVADGEEDYELPRPASDAVWRYAGILTVAAVVVFFVYHLATRDEDGRFGDIGDPAHVTSPEVRPAAGTTTAAGAAPATDRTPPAADVSPPEAVPAEAATEAAATAADAGAPAVAEAAPVEAVEPAPPAAPSAGAALEAALATARAARGREAQSAWEAVLAIQPQSAEALSELAWIAVNRRQNEVARDYARRAVAIDPTLSKAWVTLGASLQELGDRDGARAAYQTCVERGEGRNVRDCRTMLRMVGG